MRSVGVVLPPHAARVGPPARPKGRAPRRARRSTLACLPSRRRTMRTMQVAAVAALLLPLASARAGSNPTAAADQTIVIGMPTVDARHPFHATLQKSVEDEARGLGARVDVMDCFNNPFEQTNAILDFVANGVKGIVLVPLHDVTPAME